MLVGASGRVYAFEPVPRNLAYLKEHLRINDIDNVEVMEVAVSNESGVACFDESSGSAMGHLGLQGKLEVKTVKLDELFLSSQIPAPDYLKIDVEGDELLVLSGAQSMLQQARPSIFLATHGSEVHSQSFEFLSSLNYDLRAIDGRPVEQTDEIFAIPQ